MISSTAFLDKLTTAKAEAQAELTDKIADETGLDEMYSGLRDEFTSLTDEQKVERYMQLVDEFGTVGGLLISLYQKTGGYLPAQLLGFESITRMALDAIVDTEEKAFYAGQCLMEVYDTVVAPLIRDEDGEMLPSVDGVTALSPTDVAEAIIAAVKSVRPKSETVDL